MTDWTFEIGQLGIAAKDLWLLVVGAIVSTLLAIPVSYYFYRRAIARKLLYCARSSAIIVEPKRTIKALAMLYDGAPVLNLVRFRFVVWNGGNQTIDSESIVSAGALWLRFDRKILGIRGFQVKYQTRQELNVCADIIDNSLSIKFDFLDPRDGFILDVFAESAIDDLSLSERRPPSLTGAIKGMPSGIRHVDGSVGHLTVLDVIAVYVSALSAGFSFAASSSLFKTETPLYAKLILVTMIFAALGGASLIFHVIFWRRVMPPRLRDENIDLTRF